jgi:hypothetical protein
VSFDAIPTNVVQPIVCADRLDDVRRLPVTSFATVTFAVLTWCHCSLADSIISICKVIRHPPSPRRGELFNRAPRVTNQKFESASEHPEAFLAFNSVNIPAFAQNRASRVMLNVSNLIGAK